LSRPFRRRQLASQVELIGRPEGGVQPGFQHRPTVGVGGRVQGVFGTIVCLRYGYLGRINPSGLNLREVGGAKEETDGEAGGGGERFHVHAAFELAMAWTKTEDTRVRN